MVNLQLSEDEARILKCTLQYAVSELRAEIADTDRKEFRDKLKKERDALQKVVGALPE